MLRLVCKSTTCRQLLIFDIVNILKIKKKFNRDLHKYTHECVNILKIKKILTKTVTNIRKSVEIYHSWAYYMNIDSRMGLKLCQPARNEYLH